MGDIGHVTVKTDSEVFVTFTIADKWTMMFDEKADDLVHNHESTLIIETPARGGLATFYAQKDECKETKGNK
jgi:hypothetical protein